MSEQAFKESKSNLAFSQSLVEQMRQKEQMDMAQQPEMPMEETVVQEPAGVPQEEVQEEVQEEKTIVQTIKDTMAPFMEKITDMISKKEEEPKEAVLKVEGTMEPKEKPNED